MRKGVIFIVILGVMLVLFTLAVSALYLMTNEGRITEHKIKRIRGLYAAQAGIVHTLEQLRKGAPLDASIVIGAGIDGYPAAGLTVNIIYTPGGTGPGGTNPVTATVDY